MTVVGTAGTPQGMELVKNNGAHLVFNHRYADSEQKLKGELKKKYFLTNCCSHQGEGIPGAGRRSCRWWWVWRHHWECIGRQSWLGFDCHWAWCPCCGNSILNIYFKFIILIPFFKFCRLLEIVAMWRLVLATSWLKRRPSSAAPSSDQLL